MCKIMIFTNTKKLNDSQINKVLVYNAENMKQDDGFGYTLVNKNKTLFTERFLTPSDVKFNLGLDIGSLEKSTFTDTEKNFQGFRSGHYFSGLLIHGRVSTNDINLTNTHPINKHSWSLVHNGVVEDYGTPYKKMTTNDSEDCLERLVQGISEVEKHLSGYYAIGAIDQDFNTHIIRDNTASLYCAYVPSLESYIFATTQDLILGVCKTLGLTHDSIAQVTENTYLIFNPEGKLIHNQKIKPRGRSAYADSWSLYSLGKAEAYDIPNDLEDDSLCLFLEEIRDYSDYTYTFQSVDAPSVTITRKEFLALSQDEQVNDYIVIRPDGTICCPFDYHKEKLYA